MGFKFEDIPDLTGKVAIVTGGNTGIGLGTVKVLVQKNAKVYLAARSPERALPAIEEVRKEFPGAKVEFLRLDLSDLKQTKQAAENFVNSGGPLHILINNAGIMATPFELTKDGIETQFGINHIGHFCFTTTLLPALERSAPSRVVNVSSGAYVVHPKGGILFDKINEPEAMTPLQRYGQSKLANILFSKGLSERLEGKKVWVNAIHPGGVNTELPRGPVSAVNESNSISAKIFRPLIPLIKPLLPLFLMTPVQGALTQVYAATSPEIEGKDYRGQYFVPVGKHVKNAGAAAEDKELRDRLWAYSEKLVKEKLMD
ncbi:hypothetical protein BJ742DRAFT_834956 [Cladochytrium replicatum]|nr:hypothetical protein BJ742DRAFT_834956 [Cladochytrium replicatum]